MEAKTVDILKLKLNDLRNWKDGENLPKSNRILSKFWVKKLPGVARRAVEIIENNGMIDEE